MKASDEIRQVLIICLDKAQGHSTLGQEKSNSPHTKTHKTLMCLHGSKTVSARPGDKDDPSIDWIIVRVV